MNSEQSASQVNVPIGLQESVSLMVNQVKPLEEQLFGLKSTLILIKVTNVDIVYNCINDNPKSAYE